MLKLQQDNAGENKKLAQHLKSKDCKLDVRVEYMAWDTPQQNSLAEQGFTFISSKTRAALNTANIPQEQWYRLFSECAMTMTKLDWLNIVEIDGVIKTRIEHFGYGLPKFAQYLHTWGEAGTINTGKVGKLAIMGQLACSLGMPTIMKVIASICGIQ